MKKSSKARTSSKSGKRRQAERQARLARKRALALTGGASHATAAYRQAARSTSARDRTVRDASRNRSFARRSRWHASRWSAAGRQLLARAIRGVRIGDPHELAMLMLPVVLLLVTIGVAQLVDRRDRFDGLSAIGWSPSSATRPRALVGLPRMLTPLTPVQSYATPLTLDATEPQELAAPVEPSSVRPTIGVPFAMGAVDARLEALAAAEDHAALASSDRGPTEALFDGGAAAGGGLVALPAPRPAPSSRRAMAGAVPLVPLPSQSVVHERRDDNAIAALAPPLGLAVRTLPSGYEAYPGGVAQCVAPKHGIWERVTHVRRAPQNAEDFGIALAQAAREQLGEFVIYNDKYVSIAYPGGDVHPMYGVCTDVVIRAYRSFGIDLQELVQLTRSGTGDANIDHRRVEVLRRFLSRYGDALPISTFAEDYRPGDIVTYHRPQNRHSRTHIAIVSDETSPSGRPLIIHNRGWGPQQEDALFVDEITGHYRFRSLDVRAEATLRGVTRPFGTLPRSASELPVPASARKPASSSIEDGRL